MTGKVGLRVRRMMLAAFALMVALSAGAVSVSCSGGGSAGSGDSSISQPALGSGGGSSSDAASSGGAAGADQAEGPSSGSSDSPQDSSSASGSSANGDLAASLAAGQVPPYDGVDILQVNGGEPVFSDAELAAFGTEDYWKLDSLARATGAFACIGPETMPTEPRGEIGMIKPSGWHTIRYDFIDGSYLYNRCHLIGFQLTGENANDRNLITGTRFLNVDLMLPYENAVADYVERTGNHVAYRVTPCYRGGDMVATAVHLEARSVEDGGAGVRINVLLYNVQPGVSIDYATGKSRADGTVQDQSALDESRYDYIVNRNSGKFHCPSCDSVQDMKEENKLGFTGTREKAIELGYEPCGRCKP